MGHLAFAAGLVSELHHSAVFLLMFFCCWLLNVLISYVGFYSSVWHCFFCLLFYSIFTEFSHCHKSKSFSRLFQQMSPSVYHGNSFKSLLACYCFDFSVFCVIANSYYFLTMISLIDLSIFDTKMWVLVEVAIHMLLEFS